MRITLKLSGLVLLLKHLAKNYDISNCVIIHELEIVDNTVINLPNLNKIINFALQNNRELNIIYKLERGHNILINFRIDEDKKLFYIFDSLGIKNQNFYMLADNI